MTHDELKTLKATDGKDWAWLTITVADMGTIEVAGEFEPAHYDNGSFIPADFALMAAVVETADQVVDLTLWLSIAAEASIVEEATNRLDSLFRVAHYGAMAYKAGASA
jgi:hypothetical protein